jgi:drug/metabolite transporter (DMT)-like permease
LICAFLPFSAQYGTLTWITLLGLLALTLVYTLGNALYFTALRNVQLSEIDMLLRSSSFWTFVLGLLLLAEPLGLWGGVGACLILASVTVLAEKPQRLRFSRPQWLALGAALLFGAGNVLDKALSASFSPLLYTALNLLLTGFGMLFLARKQLGLLRHSAFWRPTAWVVAATFALTQLLLILAFGAGGSAGGVILVAQIRVVLLMLTGLVWLGERDRLGRKGWAALLMVIGVYSLSRLG